MQRRDLVKYLSAGIATSLAGCTSGSDGDQGGESTDTASSDGTDGGENATTAEPTTEATPSPTPVRDDLGETRTTENELRVTLSEYVFTRRLVRDGETITPKDGNHFLIARLKFRNNGTDVVSAPSRTDLLVEDADGIRYNSLEYSPSAFSSEAGQVAQPITGTVYTPPEGDYSDPDRPLEPGQTTAGMVTFEIPEDVAKPVLSITTAETAAGDQVRWQCINSQSRTVTFETDVSAPEPPFVQHETYTYTVTVTNTGGHAGKFEAPLSTSGGVYPQRDEEGPVLIGGTLKPGESLTREVAIRVEGDESFSVTFEGTVTDESVSRPTYAFGETWTTPDGLEVTVRNVQFVERFEYEENLSDDVVTEQAESGRKFLAFEVVSEYTGTDDSVQFPEEFTVELSSGEGASSVYVSGDGLAGDTLDRSYSPSTLYAYGPGDSERGWLLYDVDKSVTLSDVTLSTTRNTGFGGNLDFAQWTQSGERP